jgi:nicotinamidase/pyrazinamidase
VTARAAATAPLVVDVQNDFTEGGSLPVSGGAAVAAAIGAYLRDDGCSYDLVVATQDWRVDSGPHFARPQGPDLVDTWPVHRVAGTHGAGLHPNLSRKLGTDLRSAVDATLRKGERPAAYSGFEAATGTGQLLGDLLAGAGLTAVDVVGIASSHCVAATAHDAVAVAVAAGLTTRVPTDLTAGVTSELEAAAYQGRRAAGVELIASAATGQF